MKEAGEEGSQEENEEGARGDRLGRQSAPVIRDNAR